MSEEDTWVTATCGGATPHPRHEHAACVVGGAMLVFGGRRSATLFADVHALDLATLKWTEVGWGLGWGLVRVRVRVRAKVGLR